MNEFIVNTEASGQSASDNTSPKLKISDFKLPIIERLNENPGTTVSELIEMLKTSNFNCTPQTVRNNLKTWGYEFSGDSKQWSKIGSNENQNSPPRKTEQLNQIEEPIKTGPVPEPGPVKPKETKDSKEANSEKNSKKNLRGTTLSLNLSDKKEKSPQISFKPSKPIIELETRGRRRKNQIDPLTAISDETQKLFKPTKKPEDDSLKGILTKKSQEAPKSKKLGSKILTDSETDNREKALQEALERDAERIKSKRNRPRIDEWDVLTTPSPQPEPEADKRQVARTKAKSDEKPVEERGKRDERVEEAEQRDIESNRDDSAPPSDRKAEPAKKPKFEHETGHALPGINRRNRDSEYNERKVLEPEPAAEGNKQSTKGKKKENDQDENRKGRQQQNKQRQSRKSSSRGGRERRRNKLTITSALDDDGSQVRGHSLASLRRRREKEKRAGQEVEREKISREVTIPETITIQELAIRMTERSVDVIKLLMKQGQMMQINDILDADSAQLIAEEMGHTVKRVSDADVEEGLFSVIEDEGELLPRAPVVTIMGHVDHGKTSLLDVLRKTSVVSGEAGGITQHIGAYQVDKNDRKITFIDTPGHAAFTQMRARGARVTDIVVLVVAANDGVMPQTKEAISHAKAANVPLLLALNKIDLPSIDTNKVKTELLQEEVVVESMGGDVLEVEVSAKQGTNLDKLLDAILLQAELLELKANSERVAEGVVIEAKLDKGRGNVATILVQKGTLRVGDIVIGGSEWGRVRALVDDHGNKVRQAEPSKPVEVLGFQGTPEAGDRVAVVENESRAREISEFRKRKKRQMVHARGARGSLEQMMLGLKTEGRKEFVLIVKGDVQGSVEAINGALEDLNTDEVFARIIHSGAGGISEADVTLATASKAVILGFNVRANQQARVAATLAGVEIRYYSVIYDLVDDVKSAMSGLLTPERRETFLGNAEILEIFNISKVGKVAGCRITEGVVRRGEQVRLIRDDIVIHEGELGTLKHFKAEVKEVQAGQECGMNFETYQDMRPGDVIECFTIQEIARTL